MDVNAATLSPDVADIELAPLEERASPIPFEGAAGTFHVVVPPSTWDAMQRHAHTTHTVEVGGVLLGAVHRDAAGRAFLLIDASVPALAADSRASNVTFTADAWTRIHEVIDRDHPGASIVGWYHTHPNFGIFLSEMDVFIQRNFFDLPHQVAIVIDPVRRTHGCFVWRRGEPTEQAMVFEAAAVPPRAVSAPVEAAVKPRKVRRRGPVRRFFARALDAVAQLDGAQWIALATLLFIAGILFALLALLMLTNDPHAAPAVTAGANTQPR